MIVAGAIIFLLLFEFFYGLVKKNNDSKPKIIYSRYAKHKKLQLVNKGIVAGNSYLLYSAGETPIVSITITCPLMTHFFCSIGQNQNKPHKMARLFFEKCPEDFNAYCLRGDENKLLGSFDLQVMSYLMEFCKTYDLEIADNKIVYALKPGQPDKNNQATLLADGEQVFNLVNPRVIQWYKQIKEEFAL